MVEDYAIASCDHCGGRIEFPRHSVGMQVNCPHCAHPVTLQAGILPPLILPPQMPPNPPPKVTPPPVVSRSAQPDAPIRCPLCQHGILCWSRRRFTTSGMIVFLIGLFLIAIGLALWLLIPIGMIICLNAYSSMREVTYICNRCSKTF